MTPIPFDKFRRSLTTLSEVSLRNLSSSLGWIDGKPSTDYVEAGHALFLWLHEWLRKFLPVEPEAIQLLLRTFQSSIVDYGEEVAFALSKPDGLRVSQILVANFRHAGISGSDSFLDLRTGQLVVGLNRAACVVVSFNLCEIYLNGRNKLEKINQVK